LRGVDLAISQVLLGIALTNLLLGLFNLLPGLPLDGGRVLRGILWLRYQNLLDATRELARIARLISYAGVAAGALMFSVSPFFAIMIVLTGVLISVSSTSSYKKLLSATLVASLANHER